MFEIRMRRYIKTLYPRCFEVETRGNDVMRVTTTDTAHILSSQMTPLNNACRKMAGSRAYFMQKEYDNEYQLFKLLAFILSGR